MILDFLCSLIGNFSKFPIREQQLCAASCAGGLPGDPEGERESEGRQCCREPADRKPKGGAAAEIRDHQVMRFTGRE